MKQLFVLFSTLFYLQSFSYAATLTACASGCDHTTITAAIAAATAGDIIDIQDATHTEDNILIDKDLTIQGQGQTTTTVRAAATQAAADDPVFRIESAITVAFQNLTITNGNANGGGASGLEDGGGVYINNTGSVTVTFTNVTITNNKSTDDGGGVFISGNAGSVSFTDCVISNNEANNSTIAGQGGGIFNVGADVFNLTRCTINGNSAGDEGGGVYSSESGSVVKIINCTVFNNTASNTNSTTSWGAGLSLINATSFDVINCTIVNNTFLANSTTRQGAGVFLGNGALTFTNTIVANNSGATGGQDVYAHTGSATQITSLVEDCADDDGGGTCPTFSYTSDANIATSASACGLQSYFVITGSDAEDNGTAPSGDIPTDDICGLTRAAPHDIGSYDVNGTGAAPVELVNFVVENQNGIILLTWKTASEVNNEGFDIERSADGRDWETIGFVAGAGTSLELEYYTFEDTRPIDGINYYRLKQMDFDGVEEYHRVVSVDMSQGLNLTVFPNPGKKEVTLRLSEPVEEEAQILIYDTMGRLIDQQNISPFTNYIPLNINHLTQSGLYLIQFQSGQKSESVYFRKL